MSDMIDRDASIARLEAIAQAARELHGQFATLNFPEV